MKNLEQQIEAKEAQSPYLGIGIPFDLLMDIFLRVPAMAIARCRCVSKFWESILRSPDFTELFLTIRTRLILFTFQVDDNIFFFSSPQPQNPDENSCLVPTKYRVLRTNSPKDFSSEIGSHLCGLICRRGKGMMDTVVICNPVTGESVSLPKVESKSMTKPYLGFDPINKEFKVLCVKFDEIPNTSDEHQVLTLKNWNAKHKWRTIKCKPHFPKSGGICIDGVLYYTAGVARRVKVSMIVSFDVRSEEFSFINIDESMLMTSSCTLINYKGKLGALQITLFSPKRLELWVLEDAKWSKYIYTLPSLWNNVVQRTALAILGMTTEDEVVMSSHCLADPFYIYYYNIESSSFRRVQIQGLEAFKRKRVYISLNYAENLKLM